MTRRCSRFPLEDSTELREVHSRLHAKWGSVLDDGETPCCYALSRDHILLRAIEKLLELLPRRAGLPAPSHQVAKSSLDWLPAGTGYSVRSKMTFARTILAFLIALSVAMVPAAGAAAFKLKSQDANEMSAADAMDDCCPHAANPCDKAMADCGSMATCALKCFSFAGTSFSSIVFLSVAAKMPASVASNPLSSQTGSPPFRPPRV